MPSSALKSSYRNSDDPWWSLNEWDGLSWIDVDVKPYKTKEHNALYRKAAIVNRAIEILTTKNQDFGEYAQTIGGLRKSLMPKDGRFLKKYARSSLTPPQVQAYKTLYEFYFERCPNMRFLR